MCTSNTKFDFKQPLQNESKIHDGFIILYMYNKYDHSVKYQHLIMNKTDCEINIFTNNIRVVLS